MLAAIAAIGGILASLAKILPTFAKIIDLLYEAYSAEKKRQNQSAVDGMAARDNAAIAAAAARLPKLCPTCPFAPVSPGQHGPADEPPGV